MIDAALEFFKVQTRAELIWVLVGLGAQLMFSMRFIVQWIASERESRSVVPELFWWLSISGGLTLLAYAIHRQDPVFILGQSLGVVIYSRNLWLIYAEKRAATQTG
ncbi:lipid-A-disaccharide synthase N-terminal domain-containing protein [Psychromarinibacter sp. C21-152]|uniref:Lipid-A-disaccharide synthase N-terminal domain-containing protein n=1 Tax=Psychromarinibacter sediminicola TaxID=3033385 RepID=A0AAE3NWW6_9RHOB|nr:lipid-A-disaccharide synthase N-terminal domain-containing protein [Psychromarinibacter sediminicola]MDF0602445.1 lipid-A-disaccharide synthase N-terminal domain-containing protein [Psychromarinibacter sediminicola]